MARSPATFARLALPMLLLAGAAAGARDAAQQGEDPVPHAPPHPSAPTQAPTPAPSSGPAPQRDGTALERSLGQSSTCMIRVVGHDRTRSAGTKVEPSPAVLAGALVYTRVDVDLDEAPLGEALTAFSRAVRVNLLGLYRRNDSSLGLDREARVSLMLERVTAQEALEAILAAATGMVEITWQIRGGIIECGPKSMLAESSRREIRVYDITDIRFEVPHFASRKFDPEGAQSQRHRPKEISVSLAKLIVNQVEPEAWKEPEPTNEHGQTLGAANTGGPVIPATNLDPNSKQDIYVRGQWASLQIRADRDLVVHAPDFIHRQIGGYGALIPPAAPGDEPVPRRP